MIFECIYDIIDKNSNVILTITGLVAGIIGGTTLILLYLQIRKQSLTQSAKFMIGYVDKSLEKSKKVVDTLYEREKDNTKKFTSDKDVRVFLNKLENVIQFATDKIIDKKHMHNTLRLILKVLKEDSEVQRIINERQQNQKGAFEVVDKYMRDKID